MSRKRGLPNWDAIRRREEANARRPVHRVQQWFLRKIQVLEPDEKLIKVSQWWPPWRDSERGDFYWPNGILVDSRGGSRRTMSPIWDRNRILYLLLGPPKPIYEEPTTVLTTHYPWSYAAGNYGPKDPM